MTAGDERSVLDWANHLSTAAEASRLAVRLHLLTLLFAVSLLLCDTCMHSIVYSNKNCLTHVLYQNSGTQAVNAG